MTIPDHHFDEGINNTLLDYDMRHVQQTKSLYEKTQKDYVSTYLFISFGTNSPRTYLI